MAIVAYLQPRGALVSLWLPRRVRVSSDPHDLVDALRDMGARATIVRTDAEADAWVDDEREFCSVHEEGRGRHRCASCQSAVFQAAASASLAVCRAPKRAKGAA